MSKWDPEKYLVFQQQRTQPAIDLAKRVADRKPDTIADIGCGPGTSTAVLKAVFSVTTILSYRSIRGRSIRSSSRCPPEDAAKQSFGFLFFKTDHLLIYGLLFGKRIPLRPAALHS